MPTYQYQCRDCGHGFEQFQKFSEDPLTVCPSCGGTVARVIQNVGVVFKGSGWYINDSRKSTDSAASSTKAPAESATNGDKPKAAEPAAKSTTSSEPAKTTSASAAE